MSLVTLSAEEQWKKGQESVKAMIKKKASFSASRLKTSLSLSKACGYETACSVPVLFNSREYLKRDWAHVVHLAVPEEQLQSQPLFLQ